MSQLTSTLRMIQFQHSLFALPFALSGAWLASDGFPPLYDLLLIIVAAVAARSAAMAFNRYVDRHLDATNPRTQTRELVTGVLSPQFALLFSVFNSVVFVASAFLLAPICGWLAFPTLFLLLGYSFLKRFTLLCHFGLGLALACAPAGAWLAVSKEFAPGWDVPLWMGLGVISWVGGFDLLYAIQDLEHDKRESLFSIPSKLGPVRTRFLSLLLFCLAIFFFAKTGLEAQLLWPYYFGLVGVSLLFGIMHFLLRGNRLERIPFVFFQINAWVGLVYFAGLVASVNL